MQRMMRAGSRTWLRRLQAIGLALATGAVLTACGQAEPGVAASIDGDTLSVEELHEVSNQFFEDYPQARGQVDRTELAGVTIENFLRVRIVDEMGEAYDVVPSLGELQAYVDENYGGIETVTTQMSGVGVPSSRTDLVLDYLRFVYIENAVRELKREELGIGEGQSDELDLAMKDIEDEFSNRAQVNVNPRFGTWSGSAMTSSTLSGSGSISVVPTDAPGPGPGVVPGG